MELWVQILPVFEIELTKRKQYICINNDNKTNEQKITCGLQQGSILGPLLNLTYEIVFPSSSNLLILQCSQSIQTSFLNTRT